MPLDPDTQRYRVPTGEESLAGLRELVGDPDALPVSPLSGPTAIGMQAVGRAGGRPLQDLVLQANAILARYAPEWSQSASKVPVTFDPSLRYLGAYVPAERRIMLGPRTWAGAERGLEGPQRPLATLLHEVAHDRLYDAPEAVRWMPAGPRGIPQGMARTNALYSPESVPGEVLADAMRTRLLRKALPGVDMLGAKLGGWYDPARSLGWLKDSDVLDLRRFLDVLVR